MEFNEIIIRPIVTEKSMSEMPEKKYVFEVARTAGKIEIKNAVQKLFDVEVDAVNTINVRGKFRRQGKNGGYTRRKKKAVVTLKPSSKTIEFFDGMQ